MSVNDELNLDGMGSNGRGPKRDIKRFKVTDGSHIYRILPPFGTDHQRKASRQIQLHWGYEKKDGKPSPLTCAYPTDGVCPICIKNRDLITEAEQFKLDGDLESFDATMEAANRIKVRRSYLLNAANKDGEVGVLEIVKTAHDQLVELMREYLNKYGKNPTSLKDGVWFVFSRSGKGFKTEYKVAINKTMITLEDGDQVEKVDRTPLAMNIQENYETLAYDIHAMYKPIKGADLQRIVDGEKIDEVIKYEKPAPVVKKAEEDEDFVATVDDESEEVASPPPVAKKEEPVAPKKAAPAPKAVAKAAPVAISQVDEEEDWMKMLNS